MSGIEQETSEVVESKFPAAATSVKSTFGGFDGRGRRERERSQTRCASMMLMMVIPGSFFHFYSFAFLYHDLATRHSFLALIVCLSVRHS